jgi:hypothetical protein
MEPDLAYPLVMEAIRKESNPWVLSSMAGLLGIKGKMDRSAALEMTLELIHHPSQRVVGNALLALVSLNPSRGVEEARAHLESEDPRLRTSAIMATFAADPERAWSQVLNMLSAKEVWMRASGSFLAAKLNHPDSERALLEVLTKEEDPDLVRQTLSWFGRCGTEACLESLELISRLGEQNFRAAAQASLEQVRTRLGSASPEPNVVPPNLLESGFHLTAAIPVIAPSVSAVEEDEFSSASSEDLLRNLVNQELDQPVRPEKPLQSSASTAPPTLVGMERWEALARKGSWLMLGAIVSMGSFLWFSPRIPSPSPSPPPKPLPNSQVGQTQSSIQGVQLQDGKIDLNQLPRAGQLGTWSGKILKSDPRKLLLEVLPGISLRFYLQQDLRPPPPPGSHIHLKGKVYRKSRSGITLTVGAELTPAPPSHP